MKWFKHQSDARNSLKLRKVRRKYGSDGYAVYWFCLEAIAYDVDKDNLTFELKEDAETIGFELSIQERRVIEIMEYMVKIGLFESSSNMITCMKLAESLDKSMTNSPKMRKWLEGKRLPLLKNVMTSPDNVSTCPELEEEVEEEVEKNKDILREKLESAFDVFYQAGLVKKSKAQALKKFKSLVKETKADPFEFAELLKKDVQHRIATGQFGIDKLHPSTYLNNQRWTDEYEQNNAKPSANGRQSAAQRVSARNEQRYGQPPSSGLGMAAGNGDLRGAMDQGERGRTFEHVDQSFIEYDSSASQDWDC
jgi:hypothetical protein